MLIKFFASGIFLVLASQSCLAEGEASPTSDSNLPPIKPRCLSTGLPLLFNILGNGLGTLQNALNQPNPFIPNNFNNNNPQLQSINRIIQSQAELYQRLALLNQALMNRIPNNNPNQQNPVTRPSPWKCNFLLIKVFFFIPRLCLPVILPIKSLVLHVNQDNIKIWAINTQKSNPLMFVFERNFISMDGAMTW